VHVHPSACDQYVDAAKAILSRFDKCINLSASKYVEAPIEDAVAACGMRSSYRCDGGIPAEMRERQLSSPGCKFASHR
jgi:hypothetical protein